MDQGQKPVNPYAPAGAPYAPGSNTPAPSYASPMNQTTRPADATGASPAVPNTAASGQDIVLPPNSPEKPKLFTKKFVILIVAGLLLIAAAIVTGVILQNNRNNQSANSSGSSSSSNSAVASSCQKSFNRYANYILSGTASDEAVSSSPALSGSYLSQAFMDGQDSRAEFLRQSKQYFDEFYNCYINNNPNNTESVDNYKNVLGELSSLPSNGTSLDQAAAEKSLSIKTRVVEEIDMINNILVAEASK